MTTFTNPHERIEKLMLRVEQLEAALEHLAKSARAVAHHAEAAWISAVLAGSESDRKVDAHKT